MFRLKSEKTENIVWTLRRMNKIKYILFGVLQNEQKSVNVWPLLDRKVDES